MVLDNKTSTATNDDKHIGKQDIGHRITIANSNKDENTLSTTTSPPSTGPIGLQGNLEKPSYNNNTRNHQPTSTADTAFSCCLRNHRSRAQVAVIPMQDSKEDIHNT